MFLLDVFGELIGAPCIHDDDCVGDTSCKKALICSEQVKRCGCVQDPIDSRIFSSSIFHNMKSNTIAPAPYLYTREPRHKREAKEYKIVATLTGGKPDINVSELF